MSHEKEAIPSMFWIQLALVALFAILYFINSSDHEEKHDDTTVTERISPIGTIASEEAIVMPKTTIQAKEMNTVSTALNGEQIVAKSCFACHGTGAMNAPNMTNKRDWQARLNKGMDTLYKNGIDGIGQMPAKGGDSTLSDNDIKLAVDFMIKKSGARITSESVVPTMPIETKPQTPTIPQPIPIPIIPVTEAPKNTSSTIQKTAETVANTEKQIDGAAIYQSSCFACHGTGVANAPKFGDKAAWAPRISKGIDKLYNTALNGDASMPAMPAKGGFINLSAKEVKAAVNHMLNAVK